MKIEGLVGTKPGQRRLCWWKVCSHAMLHILISLIAEGPPWSPETGADQGSRAHTQERNFPQNSQRLRTTWQRALVSMENGKRAFRACPGAKGLFSLNFPGYRRAESCCSSIQKLISGGSRVDRHCERLQEVKEQGRSSPGSAQLVIAFTALQTKCSRITRIT